MAFEFPSTGFCKKYCKECMLSEVKYDLLQSWKGAERGFKFKPF